MESSDAVAFDTAPVEGRRSTVDWQELALIDVCHTYEGADVCRRFAFGPIDLVLRPGEITFVVGGNGSGKTTLATLIAALYRPDSGEVRLDGELLTGRGQQETRAMFAAVFNDFYLFDELLDVNPAQLVRAGGYLELLKPGSQGLHRGSPFFHRGPFPGQKHRLALLVALVEDRPIYLFDEWAADQDPEI